MAKGFDSLIDQIKNLKVSELAQLVKELEEALGVSAAMPVAAAGAAGGQSADTAKTEEKTEFKVTVTDCGPEKIKFIKALRKVKSGINLSEAKSVYEGGSEYVVFDSATKEEAQGAEKLLKEAGAKVQLS